MKRKWERMHPCKCWLCRKRLGITDPQEKKKLILGKAIGEREETVMNEPKASCEWTQDGSDYIGWETSCGGIFVLNEGSPLQNDMKFCCYCGRPLVEKPYDEEENHDYQ